MGWAASDHKKILKKVRKTGKRAELWQYPFNSENQFYYNYYQRQPMINYYATGRSSSYNYYEHGYDGHDHGYYQPPPYSTLVYQQASSIFSDENPLACSIM
ncbi:heavy metal-associated isoprenylated plant protein 28-like [Durio zibethinus]|uniref:Heavy metal-associated isoprenylated plant protein 28-like n=1 Tax=Durio zibethinus TaxID=66656 RepID=A0A6P5WXP5_DURZI|nr:heavy metal-associated isoprenylated plant protein 28-like [Durio zibethinus]